ncbi:MAG TPA: Holliday junction branch migration protein RuvA [Polyangiaceae bacterium]|nr:Holliday junction branch migration protein RuvA [Polyangiaceae bacterium]
MDRKSCTLRRMIGWLRGRVLAEEPSGALLLDVNGVGYDVNAPLGTLGRARASEGAIELFVHTHVREDALDLYGFATETDRLTFRLLLSIPNVGPKTALGVMSALTVNELARAVGSGDVKRLSKVPGIGKKTAERLVLELKDKLPAVGGDEVPVASGAPASDAKQRLLSALTNMGYRAAEAERAVAGLGAKVEGAPISELLKEALAHLG